jgi:hypothetical protein
MRIKKRNNAFFINKISFIKAHWERIQNEKIYIHYEAHCNELLKLGP